MVNVVGWLTRRNVAKELGITEQRVRLLVEDRTLRPVRDFRRRERFNPAEVAKIKARLERGSVRDRQSTRFRSGEIAAQIFAAFRRGDDLREIVIASQQTPDYVLELRQQYATMGRDFLISPRGLEVLRDLLDWKDSDEKSFITAVTVRLRYHFQLGQQRAARDISPSTTPQPNGDTSHADRSADPSKD